MEPQLEAKRTSINLESRDSVLITDELKYYKDKFNSIRENCSRIAVKLENAEANIKSKEKILKEHEDVIKEFQHLSADDSPKIDLDDNENVNLSILDEYDELNENDSKDKEFDRSEQLIDEKEQTICSLSVELKKSN